MSPACSHYSCRNLDCNKTSNHAHRRKYTIILHIWNQISPAWLAVLQGKTFPFCGRFCVFPQLFSNISTCLRFGLVLNTLQISAWSLLNLILITSVWLASSAYLLLNFYFAHWNIWSLSDCCIISKFDCFLWCYSVGHSCYLKATEAQLHLASSITFKPS